MKAMILAAGLGTRLRPLTDDRPKALVEIAGRTMLETTLGRLRSMGIQEVIINAHHFADRIVEYLKAHDNFGMRIEVSREDVLLDTGGGLKKASPFLLEQGGARDEPFILHNVDVLSTIDLGEMLRAHEEQDALATLAVQARQTSRYLLFDEQLQLCGRRAGPEGAPELVRRAQPVEALAFCGIHVISHRFLRMLTEEGVFSILTPYLRLAAEGETIVGYRADEYYWRDLGKADQVRQAEQDLKNKVVRQ